MTRAELYRPVIREHLKPVADYLYDDPTVDEVLINGPNAVYVERGGLLELTGRTFAGAAALEAAVRCMAEFVGRPLDEHTRAMDGRLPEPERVRVHVICPPLSRDGTFVSLRKFPAEHHTLESLIARGALTPMAAEYLALLVRAHRNLLISGGTSSGKTTLLGALSAVIPDEERVLVIEDSAELHVQKPHAVYLEGQPADPKGRGGATIRELLAQALRMRPDRIIVGEVRRGEALDMVAAMMSGHDGAASTIHASSPVRALVRLETLCLRSDAGLPVYVARTQVAAAIHAVVQVAKINGVRRVTDIAEVVGRDRRRGYRVRTVFQSRAGVLEPTGTASGFGRDVFDRGLAGEVRHTAPLFPPPAAE